MSPNSIVLAMAKTGVVMDPVLRSGKKMTSFSLIRADVGAVAIVEAIRGTDGIVIAKIKRKSVRMTVESGMFTRTWAILLRADLRRVNVRVEHLALKTALRTHPGKRVYIPIS